MHQNNALRLSATVNENAIVEQLHPQTSTAVDALNGASNETANVVHVAEQQQLANAIVEQLQPETSTVVEARAPQNVASHEPDNVVRVAEQYQLETSRNGVDVDAGEEHHANDAAGDLQMEVVVVGAGEPLPEIERNKRKRKKVSGFNGLPDARIWPKKQFKGAQMSKLMSI